MPNLCHVVAVEGNGSKQLNYHITIQIREKENA